MATSARRVLLAVLAIGGSALALSSIDSSAPPPPVTNPVYSEIEGMLATTFDVARWSLKVPVAWAEPQLVKAGLAAWVATLPLDPEVRARVNARLASDGMVDELVPFAIFVKEMYLRPTPEDFATWARREVPRTPAVPGLEHSLFTFTPPAEPAATAPSLPPAQAAKLLALYDAVYLQDADPAAPLADRLACDAMTDTTLEARAEAAAPIVRDLLTTMADGMDATSDMRVTLDHVVHDEDVLQAITLTLVEFVNSEVCKHYRILSARVQRQRQLEAWLDAALLDPGGTSDEGWVWLRWQANRRRAVHIVVDGLQGHLLEALARGERHDPFLSRVLAEETIEGDARPTLRSTKPGPAMATGFLADIVAAGHTGATWLPFFSELYRHHATGIARQGLSTTPTISVRNLPIAKTGAPVAGPGGTGIPNFHFVDRTYTRDGVQQGRPWYFYGNDALQLTRLTSDAGMRTMFARFDRLVTMSCGAQYDEDARYSFDSFLSLAIGEHRRDFGELRCVAELETRVTNEKRIAALRDALFAREAILRAHHHPWEWYDLWQQDNERERARAIIAELTALEPVGMPDYLLMYDPWPDHFAHAKGPFSDEIIGPTGELERLDHWVGRVSALYDEAGLGARTLFGMAGDHGLTPVRWIVSPEQEVIGGLEKAGIPLVVRKISSDEGEGPKLTNRLRPPSMRGVDVVVASTAGGNYMMDLFVDQGDAWARQPVLAELRALHTLGGKTVDIVEAITTRLGDTLDYLVVRETPCDADGGTIQVIGPRGGQRAIGTIERRGDHVWYGWTGADVLGLQLASPYAVPEASARDEAAEAELRARCVAADRADPTSWCREDQWRALTQFNLRPDAVNQLAHLYDTDRAGTINLFPRAGVGYNTGVPGRHAGESFHEKDAFVGIWGAPVPEGERLDVAVNGEVPMALYHWVTGAPTVQGQDGWGYPAMPERLFGEPTVTAALTTP
jgi:hypothetical protein